jgi:hypothetical protein|tara:strand:+ start:1595 stop:1963 length:369 start_codon:yes stop_codon:yes gene_type:complete
MTTLNSNIKFFLELQSQLKVLHWQTKSHAKHLSFGETYHKLDELIDLFVEVSMGKYGRFKLENDDRVLNINNLSDIDLVAMIKVACDVICDIEIDKKDTDLLSLRDDILTQVSKLSYLLTLR